MIKTEEMPNNRIRHYSDRNMMIRQVETGNLYADAIDAAPYRYTYEETDEPMVDEATIEDKAEAYDILMGVES